VKCKVITVDRPKLVNAIEECVGHVQYVWGAKPNINLLPGQFHSSDCSGFVRWILHYVSNGTLTIPEGTWSEAQWFKAQGFKPTTFAMCANEDDRLRLCVFTQKGGEPGHIWLVANGKTIECSGGKGVNRRAWDTLAAHKPTTFVLTDPMS
jgi:cell wall-associated NlpC family hydrolase